MSWSVKLQSAAARRLLAKKVPGFQMQKLFWRTRELTELPRKHYNFMSKLQMQLFS